LLFRQKIENEMPPRRRRASAFASSSEEDSGTDSGDSGVDKSGGDAKSKLKKRKVVQVKKMAELTDESESWDVDTGAAPYSFNSAMKWVQDSGTSRDALVQLIGALKLPVSPYSWATSDEVTRRWFQDNRGMLEKRQQTFVTAVLETYERDKQDCIRSTKKKDSAQEEKRLARERYVQRSTLDRTTMIGNSKSDEEYVFAMIFPVNEYDMARYQARLFAPVYDNSSKIIKGVRKQVIRRCAPILCKLEMMGIPSAVSVPGNRRFYAPRRDSLATAKVVGDITIRYLGPPTGPVTHSSIEEHNVDLTKVLTATIPKKTQIEFQHPSFRLEKDDFNWETYLTRSRPNSDAFGQLLANGAISAETPEINAIEHFYQLRSTHDHLGKIQMLMPETRRYRKLLAQHNKYKHVTHSILPIWIIILEFQLLP